VTPELLAKRAEAERLMDIADAMIAGAAA